MSSSLYSSNRKQIDVLDAHRATSSVKKEMKFPPLLLVFEGGCSGSTAVGRFIEKIINAHKLVRYNKVRFEFMDYRRQYKNPFYFEMKNETKYMNATRDGILLDSIEMAKKEADELGQLFYFKAHMVKVENENRKKMDTIGVAYAGVYRQNVLDRCICVTKDCFKNAAGYPVFKHNGTKADACFDRRKIDNLSPIITKFEDPKKCLRKSLDQQKRIKSQDFPSVSQESLFKFEYDNSEEAWNGSIDAWMTILRPFLSVVLDKSMVIEALSEFRGSRSPLLPHSELVFNYNYLVNELNETEWDAYLRKEKDVTGIQEK